MMDLMASTDAAHELLSEKVITYGGDTEQSSLDESHGMNLRVRNLSLDETEGDQMDVLWEEYYDVSTLLNSKLEEPHLPKNCWLKGVRRSSMRKYKSFTKIFHVFKIFVMVAHPRSRKSEPGGSVI
ncbi:hypothetical protein SUGI_0652630 [Cryptomeria japonica]|nr:hypothetical protein SUGI_0652630 [Cryptomeria japonica]